MDELGKRKRSIRHIICNLFVRQHLSPSHMKKSFRVVVAQRSMELGLEARTDSAIVAAFSSFVKKVEVSFNGCGSVRAVRKKPSLSCETCSRG